MAWNRPTSKTVDATSSSRPAGRGKMPRLRLAHLLAIVIVAGLVTVVCLLHSGGKEDETDGKRGLSAIAAAKPAKAKKLPEATAAVSRNGDRHRAGGDGTVGTEPVRQEEPKAEDETTRNPTNGVPQRRQLFTNPMDQLLAMILPNEPGGKMPPLPISENQEFSEEDEKRLLERLTANDDDSDHDLDRKELVQAMRDEYQELKKERGWRFVDYVRALDAKVRLDAEVNEESHKLHETIFNDKSISDKDYLEALEKINKVLTDRGIKPINPNPDADDDAPAGGDAK